LALDVEKGRLSYWKNTLKLGEKGLDLRNTWLLMLKKTEGESIKQLDPW